MSGASFAVSDDDIVVDEINDELVINDVLSIDDDVDILNDDVTTIIEHDESESLKEGHTVTPETFSDYFNESGNIKSTVGTDELIFEGDFSNIDLKTIIIDKSIKFTGNNAKFNGISFIIKANDVTINGFDLTQNGSSSLISTSETFNIVISNNKINFSSINDIDSFAIYALDVDNLKLINNNITYFGNSSYMISNAIRVEGLNKFANNISVVNNIFNIVLPSLDIGWAEVPAGSGNWVSNPISEGILFKNSKNVTFEKNNIKLNYNKFLTQYGYDTIYVVDFKNSDNVKMNNNVINANGMNYIYGILISGDNFTISENDITIFSDNYGNGIDVEGPANAIIENNNITVKSLVVAYPIYGAMSNGDINVVVKDNNISANSYFVCGIEIAGKIVNITNNYINIKGNYTIGIGSAAMRLIADKNIVFTESSNIGNQYVWDDIGVETAGIKITRGNATISNNDITSEIIAIKVKGNEIELTDNKLKVNAKDITNNYVIFADSINKFTVLKNNITFIGKTDGYVITNAVFIKNSNNANISNNDISIAIPSYDLGWAEVPAGSGNWVSSPISEGIVIDSSNNITFEKNNIVLKFNGVVTEYGYDTIYAIDIKNSNDAKIINNEINAEGNNYIYGIIISGDNFTISENNIEISSNDYSNGIDVEGPAKGLIENNKFIITGVNTAYPIYGAMSNGNVVVDIVNNDINGEAYLVYGIELAGIAATIENNNITVKGNYTVGIGSQVNQITISNNNVVSNASNKGNKTIWDYMGTNTEGILIKSGDAVIINNEVNTTFDKALKVDTGVVVIKNNTLNANNTSGDEAISDSQGNVNKIEESILLKTILLGFDVNKIYGDNNQYTVYLLDQNGKPVTGKEILLNIGSKTLKATTNDKGVANFDLNLETGNYTVNAIFNGTVVYSSKNTTNIVIVNPKQTVLTAPATSVLLTAVKKGYIYKISLKDNSGNVLANQKVVIDGKEFTTDKNGAVNYKLSASKEGSQKLTVNFAGNNNYAASTATATIKINKEATKLTAKKATFKAKKKSKKYSVTLKDSKGKAIAKVKVSIKVGKKTYTAKTNAKGKATFNLKTLTKKGKYSAKITFKTTALYKAVSKTVKITVKK